MHPNRIVVIGAMAAIVAASAACTVVSPDAGHERVLTEKPWVFGHGGVQSEPVKTGLTLVPFSTWDQDVDMLPQRTDLAFGDTMTATGVPVDFHVVLTFKVTDSVRLVKDFGADRDDKGNWGFFGRNLDQPIQTAVREAIKKHDMQDLAINPVAVTDVQNELTTEIHKILQSSGVPIQVISINVGRVNPPDAVKHQRIETATQEQRLITEQQRQKAEVQRKAAEEARAAADNAYNQNMHLSPEQYVQLEAIKVQREVCNTGHCTFILGRAVPTLGVEK